MVRRSVAAGCVNEHTVPVQRCRIHPSGPADRANRASSATGDTQRRAAARLPAIHALTAADAASRGEEQMIPTLTYPPPPLGGVNVVVEVDVCRAALVDPVPPPHDATMIVAARNPAMPAGRVKRRHPAGR